MTTIMFCCPCGHVWAVPDILADKPATCPGCNKPSGPEGFPYYTPRDTDPYSA